MKKVLILAYDFPPYVSVGGLRPYSWYKYLKEYGVYPIVVTRQWNNQYGNELDYIAPSNFEKEIIEDNEYGTLIKTPYKANLSNRLLLKHGHSKYKLIRKAITAFYEFFQFLFFIGSKSELYRSSNNYLKNNKVDAIIATGDPFILLKYAYVLSKKYGIPWIADYRDLWSQNRNMQSNFILYEWNKFFEKKIVNNAPHIITVSDLLTKKIATLTNNKNFTALPNGYDPEAISESINQKQSAKVLSIALVGSIYDWNPLRSFLEVISNFLKEDKTRLIEINFYGINLYGVTFNGTLEQIIQNEFPSLLPIICIHSKTPNIQLLSELTKKNVMLLFNHYSYMGTKIFDYIGIKRHILFCYSNDNDSNKLKEKYYDVEETDETSTKLQEELILKTNSGTIVKDAKHLHQVLQILYDEFSEIGFIKCNTINSEDYSRKHQVKQLADIIKKIN